ncbi:MAG TPA: NADPH-dependent FMN reductase [Burkholderiaceae bacterium]|nr:NADPH-dependent FMN reductase [Burkholderiaceae bacterium]
MEIAVLCGSLRSGSYNRALADSLGELAPADMNFVIAPDIGGLAHYSADTQAVAIPAEVERLGTSLRNAAAVVIVTPEYNYSIPGVLKNAIDWISRLPQQPFKDKPVLIQSVSTGALGGARAQYHLRQVLVFLEARVFNRPEVMVSAAALKFAAGKLQDEATREIVGKQLALFKRFVENN